MNYYSTHGITMKTIATIFSLFFLLVMPLSAQQDSTFTPPTPEEPDSNKAIFGSSWWDWDESDHEFNSWEWEHWNMDFGPSFENPIINVRYGLLTSSYKGLSEKIKNAGLVELELGYSSLRDEPGSFNYYSPKYHSQSLFLRHAKTGYGVKDDALTAIDADYWNFGYSLADGYGYSLGKDAYLFLINGGGINWTKMDVKNMASLSPSDSNLIALYDGSFRFGGKMTSTLMIKPISNAGISFTHERNIVFPRVLFWYMSLSYISEFVSQAILEGFLDEIYESSPAAGPIVGFILKAGLSFGFNELRKNDVFWPINTPSPLVQDGYTASINFTF